LTEWFEAQRRADDLLVVTPAKVIGGEKVRHNGYIIVDWAPKMRDGAVTAMNLFYYRYLRDAAWAANRIGESSRCAPVEYPGRQNRDGNSKLAFDERRGVYVNCRDENGLCRQAGMQDNVLALLWDVAAPGQTARIVAALAPTDEAFPLYHNSDPNNWAEMGSGLITWPYDSLVPMGSPFFAYFAYSMLFEIGRATAALNIFASTMDVCYRRAQRAFGKSGPASPVTRMAGVPRPRYARVAIFWALSRWNPVSKRSQSIPLSAICPGLPAACLRRKEPSPLLGNKLIKR